jgi:hypothetical protein
VSPGVSPRRPNPAPLESADWDGPYIRYDLVKEFVIALVVVTALIVVLAILFSSPDDRPVTIQQWARTDPSDFVTTAVTELDGSSEIATYGPPYTHTPGAGQKIGPLNLQSAAGVHFPINTSQDFVLNPLRSDYGPVAPMMASLAGLAATGGLDGALLNSNQFYQTNYTKPLLFLSGGGYFESRAEEQHLLGTQWGMMNETGSYPGQVWLWLYTFWYQIAPFNTSVNADAQIWFLMMILSLAFVCIPFIPGLRGLPRHLGVHRLIWRDHYRRLEGDS